MTWKNIDTSLDDKIVMFIIEEKDAKKSIRDILKEYLKYYNEQRWRSLFANNSVYITINNTPSPPQTKVEKGDVVLLTLKKKAEPNVNKKYTKIYEDEHILVIDKPSNLPVHPSGRYHGNTLVNMLKKHYPNIKVVNRLDKQTSGIIIFAKDAKTAKHLGKQFEQRRIQKIYKAKVKGKYTKEGIIDEPIGESTNKDICKMMVIDKKGKASQTKITIISANDKESLLKCEPITGRTHQIRVHLQHMGHPIINDTLYGGNPQEFLDELEGKIPPKRLMLHCYSMTITHPQTKKKQTFVSKRKF